MNDEGLLDEIHEVNNHSKATRDAYKKAVKKYTSFTEKSLYELIIEAEEEENQRVRWKLSSVRRRLIGYRKYLLDNYAYNSFRTFFGPIVNIYRYYDIEIYDLPRLNHKSIKKSKPLNFRDLPDKEIIRKAIGISSPLIRAVILFMCSSGCAVQETVNLTVGDYLKSISDYTDKTNVFEAINDIGDRKDIVPTWDIWRQKTNKYYTTYSSPESVTAINSYLISRTDDFTNDSKLFKYNKNYIQVRFIRINNELNLDKVGDNGYNRFRTHMLRKFHASALYNDGMSLDNVNDLQGKAKNKTDQPYFMVNPDDLKYEYIQHLHAVTINKDVEKLSIKSPEYIKMEKEKEYYKSQMDTLSGKVDFLMEHMLDGEKESS